MLPNHNTDVEAAVMALRDLDLDGLRQNWRSRFGQPPALRSGDLMRRCLAERIQLQAFGRDRELERQLDRLASTFARSGQVSKPKTSLKPGAVLVREHDGVRHQVEVLADGFSWNGRHWKSLSEIARAITGVRWNGPRFFGLRKGGDTA